MKLSFDDMTNILIGANLFLYIEVLWVSKVQHKLIGKEFAQLIYCCCLFVNRGDRYRTRHSLSGFLSASTKVNWNNLDCKRYVKESSLQPVVSDCDNFRYSFLYYCRSCLFFSYRWNYNVWRPSSVRSGFHPRGVHNVHGSYPYWITYGGINHSHVALAHAISWSHQPCIIRWNTGSAEELFW